jgi:hypothetical protein
MEVSLLQYLRPAFQRTVAEEGFMTTDGALGILATGTLDSATIHSLLKSMPPGTWELVTHPGHSDGDLARVHTRLKESRETEFQALKSIPVIPGLELIGFPQVAADGLPNPSNSPTQ